MPHDAVIDQTKTVEVNVACTSPHVIAYKFWMMKPGGQWTVVKTGQTGDDIPDFFPVGPAPKGTRLAYWLGVGGNANTVFQAAVTLSQDGQIVPGGFCAHTGTTNEHHVAEVQDEVDFV